MLNSHPIEIDGKSALIQEGPRFHSKLTNE